MSNNNLDKFNNLDKLFLFIGAKLFYGGPRRELTGKKEDVFVRRFPLSLTLAGRGKLGSVAYSASVRTIERERERKSFRNDSQRHYKFDKYHNNKISLNTFNCQRLHSHKDDLSDSISQKSDVLLLTETWMKNEQKIHIPNFRCIAQFKLDETRAAGVAIYQNITDVTNIITLNMEILVNNSIGFSISHKTVGDICSATYKLENGDELLMAAIYYISR